MVLLAGRSLQERHLMWALRIHQTAQACPFLIGQLASDYMM